MGKELEVPAERSGWKLKLERDRNSEGWLLQKADPRWKNEDWSGVWVWRLKRDALKYVVGVQGWPDNVRRTSRNRLARQPENPSTD